MKTKSLFCLLSFVALLMPLMAQAELDMPIEGKVEVLLETTAPVDDNNDIYCGIGDGFYVHLKGGESVKVQRMVYSSGVTGVDVYINGVLAASNCKGLALESYYYNPPQSE